MLIFMEYCADGTIAEICKLDIPEALIRVYTNQITKAINFLHKNGIIHRDIKGKDQIYPLINRFYRRYFDS